MKSRKKKRKSYKKYIFLMIFILICTLYAVNRFLPQYASVPVHNNSNYSEIRTNSNYPGIGQKLVSRKDGYVTTFTTSDGKTYKEYKQNGNSSWAERYYWNGTMAENGCGITCLAILSSGYGMNYTPESLRKKYAPNKEDHLDGNLIPLELNTYFHLDNSDFYYASKYFEKDYVFNQLKDDKPILICVWDKPNSKWTTSSHYMLLLATDNISKVYVSNPNGIDGSSKMSGWYEYNDVLPYIAKALYIE